eukprot:COSAG06_NODE_28802_length_567_cov_11.963675_1_plen_62_part_10
MLKTRKQEKEAAARKWANDYCATFPEPGCVKQHRDLLSGQAHGNAQQKFDAFLCRVGGADAL